MNRIGALESLRGLMALWVVVGHAFRYSGYMPVEFGPLRPLFEPGYAVDVFIILSGFVIFFLLDHQPSSYRAFIVRRFFRLFPLFFVVLLVSALLHDWKAAAIDLIPWQSEALAGSRRIHADTSAYFWPHFFTHLTMLHGVTPLPSSDYAFVGQAWSISVEWQFYLVAPFLFWMIAAGKWRALAVSVATICVLRFTNFGYEGFAVRQAGYFLVGILSYFAYRRLHAARIEPALIDAMVVVAAAAVYLFLNKGLSLMLWAVAFGLIVAQAQTKRSLAQTFGLAVLNHPILQWIGAVSYSIYMVHALVLTAMIYAILAVAPEIPQQWFALALLAATAVLSVAVSAVTHRLIEKPGMSWGKRLSATPRASTKVRKGMVAEEGFEPPTRGL